MPTPTTQTVQPRPVWNFNHSLAASIIKLISLAIQLSGKGSATSLPGKLALRLFPQALQGFSLHLPSPSIMLTGTNGKTTTATLIRDMFNAAKRPCLLNERGANLHYGIATALGQAISLVGRYSHHVAVIETDEATVGKVAPAIRPTALAVTNLFRDQLDRYGELSTTAAFIEKGIPHTQRHVFLNADDPMVVAMGRKALARGLSVSYFGMEATTTMLPASSSENVLVATLSQRIPHPQEAAACPECGETVAYHSKSFAHLGHWHCPACGTERPPLDVGIRTGTIEASGWALHIATPEKSFTLHSPLFGNYNAYNIAQAVAIAGHYGVTETAMQAGLSAHEAVFGRAERRTVQGKSILIMLMKNPAGASEVLALGAKDPKARFLLALNDSYADGEDVSWIWDADFEQLLESHPQGERYSVAGVRAYDMANRLSLCSETPGWQPAHCGESLKPALEEALATLKVGETLYLYPTYTALLELDTLWKSMG
jgi:lipid II isoglutaminyl synthase (glutamine-hydrolysing)